MITKIHVKNYRSLGDVTLEMGRLNVLVGPNGYGKSNFVDALRFVAEALRLGLDSAIRKRHGIDKIRRWAARKANDILFEFEIKETRENAGWAKYSFKLEIDRNNKVAVGREFCSVHWKGKVSEYIYEKGKPVKSIRMGLNPALDESSLALTAIAGAEPFSFVYSTLADVSFCSIFPNVIKEPQKPGSPDVLEEHGSNLATVLKNMEHQRSEWLPDLKSALSKIVPDIENLKVQNVGGYLAVKLFHPGPNGAKGNWFDASQESDGTLRVLGLLAALYNNAPGTLLAIEEPEITIHPVALGVLADVITEAGSRMQLLLTTHSPDLISRLPVKSLRAVEKLDGVTIINEIDETQRKVIEQRLFSAGDLLRLEGLGRRVDEGGQ